MALNWEGEECEVRPPRKEYLALWLLRGGDTWAMEMGYALSLLNSAFTGPTSARMAMAPAIKRSGVGSTSFHSLLSKLYCQDACHVTQCSTEGLGPCAGPDARPEVESVRK